MDSERFGMVALLIGFLGLLTAVTYGCTYQPPGAGVKEREAQMIEGKLKLACIQNGGSIQMVNGAVACLDRNVVVVDNNGQDEVYAIQGTNAQKIRLPASQ